MKDLTRYEYQEQVQRMTDILRDAPGWGEGYDSAMGQQLIQLVADMTDNLGFMLERRTVERHLISARIRSSIISGASELGYRFRRAVANSGMVQIVLDQPAESNIDIPEYTEITQDGDPYVTMQRVLIPAGETTAEVRVKQGELNSVVFQTNEPTFEERSFLLIEDFETIDNDVFFINSGGQEYRDVRVGENGEPVRRALSFLSENDAFYDIRFSHNGMRVLFGDGTFGKKPTSQINIQFVRVDLDETPLLTTGNEFDFGDTVQDLSGTPYTYTATNITQVRGALPPESDQSIKDNAIEYNRTNGRASSNEDYAFWVKQSGIGNIIDVKASGETELDSLVYNLNNIYLTYLKESGESLTAGEEAALFDYLKTIREGQVYPIFQNADRLLVQFDCAARKKPNVPISNSEFYQILNRFLEDYLKLQKGSVGRNLQKSDIIRDMYNLTIERQGITYNVLDYARLDMYGMYPVEFPNRSSDVFVRLDPIYMNSLTAGDKFVLIIDNLVCEVEVESGDDIQSILLKMRDRIYEVTKVIPKVEVSGIAFGLFDQEQPVQINPRVGTSNLLIGVDTPYFTNTDLVKPPVVGSSMVDVTFNSPAVDVRHFYYSSPAGRRPTIPLRVGTRVQFTAPSDTSVNVYARSVLQEADSERLITTLEPNQSFNRTFTKDHGLVFEYVEKSTQDRIVNIRYPEFSRNDLIGIRLQTRDGFGKFEVEVTSGDLAPFTSVLYNTKVPKRTTVIGSNTQNILPNSFSIIKENGELVYTARSDGLFEKPDGTVIAGRVNYNTGDILLPVHTSDGSLTGKYFIKYQQDEFQNLIVDSNTAIDFIRPKNSLSSTDASLSTIRVE